MTISENESIAACCRKDTLWPVLEPSVHSRLQPGAKEITRQEDAWHREWRSRLWRKRISDFWKPLRRSPELVKDQYEDTWAEMDYADLRPDGGKQYLLSWGEDWFKANAWVIPRVHLLVLHRLITLLKPRSVLELGFGRGLNLLCLSSAFPEIHFAGVELTETGCKHTRTADARTDWPPELRAFCPFPLPETRVAGRLDLRQASAASLPFENESFDLVYSRQAMEQMEPIRPKVFDEARRVCRQYGVFFEAFQDFNARGTRRMRIKALDYFQARLADLPGHRFELLHATSDFPIKPYMCVGLAVARAC